MDETFFIKINCSSILLGSEETQYTMLIDSAKISIVYELLEWIRWIFSVNSCINLVHENSVIHELEDIRILSKLKNFEIKPCGRYLCVHKNTYRTLLNNLNLFVNWNEMKVHKFFLEKLNQMNAKLQVKSSITSTIVSQRSSNKRLSPEKSCNNQSSNSNTKDFLHHTKKRALLDTELESASINKSSGMNGFNKKNSFENLLINFDDISDFSTNSSKVLSRNVASNMENSVNSSPEKHLTNINSELSDSESNKLSSFKSSHKFIRPFSLGQILTNIREDFEKQKKNDSSHTTSDKSNHTEIVTPENLLVPFQAPKKKRQRIRKKKMKKQNAKDEPILDKNSFTDNFKVFHSNTISKPNHIRFDAEEEGDMMETDFVEDKCKMESNETEQKNDSKETFIRAETLNLNDDNSRNFLKLDVSTSESKIENSNENESKIIVLEEQVCDNFKANCMDETIECNSFHGDLNTLQSLKEKIKNVVLERFY